MLFLCARLGMDGGEYQAVEYAGEAIVAMPMQERMTLANMTAELGGADRTRRAGCDHARLARRRGRRPTSSSRAGIPMRTAPLRARHRFDAAALAPQVAAPHSPANAAAGGRARGHAAHRRLHRRVHRRQARRPADGGARAAPAAQGGARAPAGGAGVDARCGGRARAKGRCRRSSTPAPSCCPAPAAPAPATAAIALARTTS